MSNEKFIEQFKTIRFCSHYLRSENSKEMVEKHGDLLGDRLASFKKLSSKNKDKVVEKYVENLMMNVVDLSELIADLPLTKSKSEKGKKLTKETKKKKEQEEKEKEKSANVKTTKKEEKLTKEIGEMLKEIDEMLKTEKKKKEQEEKKEKTKETMR